MRLQNTSVLAVSVNIIIYFCLYFCKGEWYLIKTKKLLNGCYKASAEKRDWARQSGKKRKFIRGKREGDWLLRTTGILPFWWSPPKKNSLKGWSHSWRSGIWWSRSFKKIDTSEITGCHLGNLVSLTDHCDLFFVYKVDLMSHLINEPRCGPYHSSLLF